ncbi:MAG: response regulator [Rhizobiales bacterium]|nr:response regulator [Hyphomicrobiales bacterium]
MPTKDKILRGHASVNEFSELPVLIVDDDPVTRRLISGVFEMHQIGPITMVETLGEAGHAIVGQRFNAVIADLHLPDGNGMELVHMVRRGARSKNRDCALIVCSAYAHERTTRLILALGADAVLGKPVDPSALLELVKQGRGAA